MTASENEHGKTDTTPITRRRFLAGTGASVVAFTILKPGMVGGADANSKIDIGLIGCGGRGKWIADLFLKNGGYNLVAVADYFQDHADEAGTKFNVPATNRYTGLSGYHKLLEQKLDAVVIETPPYFHPEQAAAAVDAGKHVYSAKPIAVDVPGCLTYAESGKKATAKKLCFLVDFQTRANKLYQAAVTAVHGGQIGKIVSVESNYQCDATWGAMDQVLRKDPKNPEVRLRAWGVDRLFSGDIITEQNIHALDVTAWMLDAEPVRAYGTGGRKREFLGDCWDHFAVIFYYPNDIVVSFNSHQMGYGYDDIMCRVYGFKGTADTHYFGNVTVKANEFRMDGSVGNLFTDGVVTNIATFHDNIINGECSNPTVPASVRSNLTTILGRTAAYRNGVVTWDEMMRRKEKFTPDLKGLKA
jgi:predicted dehydrogenase